MDRILVVEDDFFFREMYAGLLQEQGYDVEVASSGEQALDMLAAGNFGLILTDLVMAGMNGIELLTRVKGNDPSRDVILVTGNADLESAIFALKNGARDYLLKPINPDELLHSVRLCMEERRLLGENVQLRNMLGLFQTSQALASCMDLDRACHLAVDALAREVGVVRGMGMILDEQLLTVREQKGIDEATAAELCQIIQSYLSQLSKSSQILRIVLPVDLALSSAHDIRECCLFPLVIRGNMIGLVALYNDAGQTLPNSINDKNIIFLADQAVRAIDNASKFSATRDMLYIDELSGLFNYRYLKIALDREIKRADRYSTNLTVAFLDLDYFKTINDTHGHMVGSSVLREMGGLLKNSVREVDVVIRYGGDEYTIILVETGPDTAQKVVERIRYLIESHTFLSKEGYQIKCTASLGYACYPEDTSSMQELLGMADRAMYAGKAAGKNCVYRVSGPLSGAATTIKE
jgi:two-component system, cell cycle response regulator